MKSREWATLGVQALARVHGSTETTEPIREGESAEEPLRYNGGNIGAFLRDATPSRQVITRVAASVWPARYAAFAPRLARRGMAIPMMRGLPR